LAGALLFPIVIDADKTDFPLFGDYGPLTKNTVDFYDAVKPDLMQLIKDQGFAEEPTPSWWPGRMVLQNRKKPYATFVKRYGDLAEVHLFVQPSCEFYDKSDSPVGIEVRYIYRYLEFYYSRPRFLSRDPVEMWKLHDKISSWWKNRCQSIPRPFTGGGSTEAACISNTASQPVQPATSAQP
jgi:hypothetical protein